MKSLAFVFGFRHILVLLVKKLEVLTFTEFIFKLENKKQMNNLWTERLVIRFEAMSICMC